MKGFDVINLMCLSILSPLVLMGGESHQSTASKAVLETCDLSNKDKDKDKDKYIKIDLVILSLIRVVNIFHNIFLCELSHRELFHRFSAKSMF